MTSQAKAKPSRRPRHLRFSSPFVLPGSMTANPLPAIRRPPARGRANWVGVNPFNPFPKSIDSKSIDSKSIDSKSVDSKSVDSKPADWAGVNPFNPFPKSVDSKSVDSKSVDSKSVDSRIP